MLANNGLGKEKFTYAGQWPTKGKGQAEEAVDGSSKGRFEEVQPQDLTLDRWERSNRIHVADLNIVETRI